jgi:hypothetical protein
MDAPSDAPLMDGSPFDLNDPIMKEFGEEWPDEIGAVEEV